MPRCGRFQLYVVAHVVGCTRPFPQVLYPYVNQNGVTGPNARVVGRDGNPAGSGYPIGAIITAPIADHIERRTLIFASTVVWLVGMLLIGSMANSTALTLGAFLTPLAPGLYLQVA